MLQSRREGKRTFYKLNEQADATAREFIQLATRGAKELGEHPADQVNLKRILARRQQQAQLYFNQIAGRFDRSYGPGRSWQAFGQLLLRILPPLTVADLGAGEGLSASCSRAAPRRSSPSTTPNGSSHSAQPRRKRMASRTSSSGWATLNRRPSTSKASTLWFSARRCTMPRFRLAPSPPPTTSSNPAGK